MMPSLHEVARALGGKVQHGKTGAHVVAPSPGRKRKDRSLSVWINGERFGIYSHRRDHWRDLDAYVREKCGLRPWAPTPKKRRASMQVSFSTRNMFFAETLAMGRHRQRITFDQFMLLINDLRLRDEATGAINYAREFGFTASDLERAMQATPRHYTADERAKIFNLTYAERQNLGLRRTGSIDVEKAGRERARRDRYNAKRRAARQSARSVKVLASIEVPSSLKVVGKHGPRIERKEVTIERKKVTRYSKTPEEGDSCWEKENGGSLQSRRTWRSGKEGRSHEGRSTDLIGRRSASTRSCTAVARWTRARLMLAF